MGAAQSSNADRSSNTEEFEDPWWPSLTKQSSDPSNAEQIEANTNSSNSQFPATEETNRIGIEDLSNNDITQKAFTRSLSSQVKLEIFKKEFEEKRIERQAITKQKKMEWDQLRQRLEETLKENEILKSQLNDQGDFTKQTADLIEYNSINIENMRLKAEIQQLSSKLSELEEMSLKYKNLEDSHTILKDELKSLRDENLEYSKLQEQYNNHVDSLKDIINISKKVLEIRGNELVEARQKCKILENSLADREMQSMSNELRDEYERQLRKMRSLRELYTERAHIYRNEVKKAQDLVSEIEGKLTLETDKNSDLEERIAELEENVSKKYDVISNLESTLGLSKAECRGLKHEMDIINQLFAQFLLGFNSETGTQELNLDKLVTLLEDNHDLLADIGSKSTANESTPALPRLLLNLVTQVQDSNIETDSQSDTGQASQNCNKTEDIISNLPKVWRVLIELLSHHTVPSVAINSENPTSTDVPNNPCYKTVETPSGTRYELSVSKTYIRLKDLIMEKKYLQKEMHKMKTLNAHLEERLQNQEARFVLVTNELSKTWHYVNRMQRQHEQLHTHEKVLRYELSQKRKMLCELKEELDECKQKWMQAREKNTASESACRELRTEFALRRKHAKVIEDNSAESGYSDGQEEFNDEDEKDTEFRQSKVASSSSKINSTVSQDPSDQARVFDDINHNDGDNPKETCDHTEGISEESNELGMDEIVPAISDVPTSIGKEDGITDESTNINEEQNGQAIDIPTEELTHESDLPNCYLPANSKNDESITDTSAHVDDEQNGQTIEIPTEEFCCQVTSEVDPPSSDVAARIEKDDGNTDTLTHVDDEQNGLNIEIPTEELFFELTPESHSSNSYPIASIERDEDITDTSNTNELSDEIERVERELDNSRIIISQSKPILSKSEAHSSKNLTQEISQIPQIINRVDAHDGLEATIKLSETTSAEIPIENKLCTETSSKVERAENLARKREDKFRTIEEHANCITNTYSRHKHYSLETARPSTSNSCQDKNSNPSTSQLVESRDERFARLEEQCKQLKSKYSSNTKKGTELCSRLDAVHLSLTKDSSPETSIVEKPTEDLIKGIQNHAANTEIPDIHPIPSTDSTEIGTSPVDEVQNTENPNSAQRAESFARQMKDFFSSIENTNFDTKIPDKSPIQCRLGSNQSATPSQSSKNTEIPVEEVSFCKNIVESAENFARQREDKFKKIEEHATCLTNTFTRPKNNCLEISVSNLSSGREDNSSEPSTSQAVESREERFARLEEQCKQLKSKYSSNTKKGTELCSRLDALHLNYETGDTPSTNSATTSGLESNGNVENGLEIQTNVDVEIESELGITEKSAGSEKATD